jgi:rhomboid protease GluP
MQGFKDDERGQDRELRQGMTRSPLPNVREFFAGSPVWATASIIAINFIVFALMAVKFETVSGFTPLQLAVWGGNSGQFDLEGQWWRLITYQFLHVNLLHLLINMWVMWTVGCRAELFYGSVTLIALYLGTGALAGLTSIVWNPDPVSVGASGSIFGILAAFIVFFYRARHEVPTSILRYWLPALLFAAYSLYSGAFQPAIDNAAHVGGFIAGFVLGGIVARPLDSRVDVPVRPTLVAAAAFAVLAAGLLWYIGAFSRERSPADEFAATHRWYADQETANLELWMNLAGQAATNSISSDDLAARFSHDIFPSGNKPRPGLPRRRSGQLRIKILLFRCSPTLRVSGGTGPRRLSAPPRTIQLRFKPLFNTPKKPTWLRRESIV